MAIFNSYVCLPEGICHIYIYTYIYIHSQYIYICLKIIEDDRTSLKIPRLFSVRKVRGFVCFLFDFVWMRRYSCWNIAKMRKVHIFRVKNEFFFSISGCFWCLLGFDRRCLHFCGLAKLSILPRIGFQFQNNYFQRFGSTIWVWSGLVLQLIFC